MKRQRGLLVGLAIFVAAAALLGNLVIGFLNYQRTGKQMAKMADEITKLKGEIAGKLQGVVSTLVEVRAERDSLQKELAGTKEALRKQERTITALKEEIKKQNEGLAKLRGELVEMKGYLDGKLTKIENTVNTQMATQINMSERVASLEDSIRAWGRQEITITNPIQIQEKRLNWGLNSGVMVWSAGKPWDLSVPYIGISLKREKWVLELQGGVTPWSKQGPLGNRGDAMVLGAVSLYPDSWVGLKMGVVNGWEYFSSGEHIDTWTMKISGITLGPEFRWGPFAAYLGGSYTKIGSLTGPDKWRSGGMLMIGINFR